MTAYLNRRLRKRATPTVFLAIWVACGICSDWVVNTNGAEPTAPAKTASGAGAPAPSQQAAPASSASPPTAGKPAPTTPPPAAKLPETPAATSKQAPAETKAAEAKPAESKPVEQKPAEPKPPEPKPAEAKPAEPKPAEQKPVEAKPPEAKPAESKPAEAAKPGPSYTLLARPAVADRLKLSDEQRAKVALLLAERRESLEKATEADRAKVLEQSEKKLGEVLSDAQRADFTKIPPEPLLKFKFRFQRWVDVLEEVARQAGLSLVLDAPPPGTLNYSDDKEYTPTEAIDLLNSVLLTKGYTLIRRDRMLVCVSIEEGIPEGLVPRVTLDELDYRGKFELVTVVFPVEGRAPAAAAEEIKPLLSPLGKVVPLPATSQLLITDTAGKMRDLRAQIKAVPAKAPTAVAQPAKAEPPVFTIYPLKGVDPASVLTVMKTLYPAPASNFVLDPKTDQLSVHAGASVQASVKAILEEMMKTGQPAEKQSRLELYTIDESRGPQILKSLEGIAPNAKLTLDTKGGRIVAWATGADQDLLKKALEKLGMGPVSEARQFEVYRLTKADPKSALALLESLLPTARLAVDAPTNSLVVIGTAADQKAVKSLLEQLQPEKPGPETPELRFYQLTRTPTPGMAKVIEGLAPKAHVTIDPTNKRLMVVAPAVEHTAVKSAVEQFEKGLPEEKGKLVAYPVTQAQRKRFQAVLKTLTTELPGIEVIADAEPGELAVWAKPEQHKVIAEVLEQLKREVPAAEKYVLAAYALTTADPTSVTTVLKSMFPTLQVVHDPKTNRLLAWALPSEQEALKKTIDQLQAQAPTDKLPRFETYLLHGAEPTALTASLQTLAPNAKITSDAKAGRLVVWATPAEHEVIRGAMEKLGRGTTIENTPQVESYRLSRVDPTTLVPLLQSLVPDAKISVDAQTKTLIVVAIPADQQTVRGVVQQFQPDKPGRDTPELRAYPITSADPASVMSVLKTTFPTLQITLEPKTNRLLAWAAPFEHDALKKTLEQVQAQVPPDKLPRFETYALHGAEPTALTTSLQTLAPNAKITSDAKAGRLVVWATPAEHEVIRGAMEKLGRGTTIENTPQVESYRLSRVDPTTLVPLLQSLVPDAKVSVDTHTKTLIVIAIPADQQTVRGVVQQFQPEKPGRDAPERFEVYPVHGADPTTLVAQLQTLVPNAKLAADAKSGRIVAWGTPADHESLKAALEKMVHGSTPESMPRLEVYRLTKADATTLTPLLQTLVPDAKISIDAQTKSLIAIAVPADHLTIKTVLEQLQPERPAPDAPQLRFYPLAQPLPGTIVTVLQGLAPKAQVTLEPGGKRLTVVASPADHAIVKAAIEQIQTVAVLDEKARLTTYPVTPGQKKRFQSVATSLSSELPGIQVVADGEPDELAIWAKPSQHAVIAEILEQLKQEVPAAEKYRLVAYAIKAADPQNVLTVMKTLFPNAQFVLDARTRRLIVWTLPADQEAIKAALEKVDPGTAAEGQDKLMVYPVPDIDPSMAIKMLQEQLPEVKLSADTKSGAILAWARPAEHEVIARTLKQLKVEPDAEHKETLVVYPLPSGDATALVSVLKTLVPKAQVAVEAKTNNILATAVPKDHELIRAAIEQVSKKGPAGTMPEMVVHSVPSLGPSGAASIIPTLQQIFPNATFAAGADATKLVVWARPTDQEAIRKAVEELAKKEPVDSAHKLVIYTIDTSGPGSGRGMLTILRSLFPDGSFGYGSDPGRLFVWARPADHPAIKNTIDEMTKKEPAETAHRLVVFTLDKHGPSGAAGVLTVLQTMFPGIQFSAGAEPDQIVAFVQPAEEKRIQEALKTLVGPEDPKKAHKMVVYTLESTGPAGVTGAMSVLSLMFPEAKFSAGTEPHKLVAWARPAEHEKIKAAVEELGKKEPPEKARKVVVYKIRSANASASYYTLSLLKTMFPEAQFTLGTENDQLVVWARPAEHVDIKSTIDQISLEEDPAKAHKLVIYTLETTGAAGMSGAISLLTSMFPEARFTPGSEPDKVAVWARPADHKKIEAAVKELSGKEPPEKAHRMVVYAVETAGAAGVTGAISILTTMFPDAKFAAGTEPNKVVAWARPADQKRIAAAVAELSKKEPPETARKVVVYKIRSANASASYYTLSLLKTMFPEAQFTVGTENDQLVVWARPAEHVDIKSTIDQISLEEGPEKAHKLVIYTLETTGAAGMAGAISLLTSMFPEARFTPGSEPDKVAVWARPADHKKIEAAVKELSSKEPPEKAHQMVVYAIETAGAAGVTGAISILTTMFPDAKFAAGTEPNKVVAWARPTDQKRIAAAVAELSKKEPPETARKVVVYPFKSADSSASYYTLAALRTMFPDAQFSLGADPSKLAVWARPAEHDDIKTAIEQLSQEDPPEKARRMVVYTLESVGTAGVTGAIGILTAMFPEAKFSEGAEPDQVAALARPADHERIKAAVAELSKKEPPEKARKIVVYPFKSAGPRASYYTINVLRAMFPDAQFSVGADRDKLIVWARPAEHTAIKNTIEQVSQEDPPERAFKLVAYTLESTGPAATRAAITLLGEMFPEAHFTPGSEAGKVVAWARPDDHAKIKSAVEELSKQEPPEKAAQAAVYQLNSMSAKEALPFLTAAFPEAQFSAGSEPHALIVWARPPDQKQIKAAVEKIDVEGTTQLQRTVAVYPLKAADATSLQKLLDPMTRRNVEIVADSARQRLIVWADPKQQEAVRKTVEQFQKENAKIGEPSTQVYRFQWADPQAADTVLGALVPAAQIALDTSTHSLVVTATPEDHAKIKAAIEEMDRRDADGQAPRLQIHRVTTADPTHLLTVLQGLFRARRDVELSLDEQNDAIVAVASPAQHETIRNLIGQLEKETKADSAARLVLYPLKDADPDAALTVLNHLFEKQGAKVRLSVEPRDNQLVAIARPEQHAAIAKALDQLRGEERVLEILTLDVVDPWSAQMAIDRLFSDGAYPTAHAPAIDVDPASQQLFVRATKEQMTKIRELLVKLGETGLAAGPGTDLRRSRTVPFDGDLSAALDEIQRVWPQLRKNPIQVVKPAGDIPVQGRLPRLQQPAVRKPIQPAAGPKEQDGKPLPRNEAKPPSAPPPDAKQLPPAASQRPAAEEKASVGDGWRASKAMGGPPETARPVVVIPGEGSVTIASDDPAALNQFEELLRALSRQRGVVGRNFTVYLLRYAKATDVAQTLQRVFRTMPGMWRGTSGSVVLVPDERLNAIVAYASRADRATIESLLKILDTSEVPESVSADRLHLIRVKNTSAARIERMLRDLFRNHADAFSVEEATNSVVVMASGQLVDEITRVITMLDEAAGGETSRNVAIIPLKKANAERVEKALDVILKSGSPRSGR